MEFGMKSLSLLSTRFSLFAVTGVALLAALPNQWVANSRIGEQRVVREPAELASPVSKTSASVQRIAVAHKRGAEAKSSPKARDVPPVAPVAPKAGNEAVSEPPPPLPEPAPPPPDVWSDAQIIAALRECVRLLAPIAAEIEVSESLKKGECGTPAPVELHSIGGADKVEFRPAVPLNCRMVAALHKWIKASLQPAAREVLGSTVTRISGGSYSCRNRYGSPDGPISEHAFANAIDIASFSTADGRTVNVLKHWGPTARDIEAARVAAAKVKSGGAKMVVLPKDPEGTLLPQHAADRSGDQRRLQTAQMRLGGTSPATAHRSASEGAPATTERLEARFLHRLHEGACAVFGTVLGPEANDAHRNHFHLDMAARRGKGYCH